MDASIDAYALLAEIDALYRQSIGTAWEKPMCTLRASAALKLGPLVASVSPVPEAIVEAISERE